jgi:MFS transporter, PPP family, 3-phenylpropionic acid transporter
MSMPERRPTATALVLYYLVLYAAVGVTLPFFPQYLKSLGLTSTEVGLLLAVGPALSMLAPPLWGQLADRTGRPGVVLFWVTLCSAACFSLFIWVRRFDAVFVVLLVYASFSTAIQTLIDAMTLRHVARHGGTFARLRLFGSVGFAVASLSFGRLVDTIDVRVVTVSVALMLLAAAWTWAGLKGTPVRGAVGPQPTAAAALELTRSRDMRVFLLAVALHWFACGPYHSALSIHITALELPPSVVGDTATLGVVAEVVVMSTWPRWGHRISPRALLFLSFGLSGVRWALMALTSSGTLIVALGLFHALTYGTFFLASVAYMTERAPESLRATGQALFVAAAYGVGGLSGYLATGIAMDRLPGHAVFAAAAVSEVLAALLVLNLSRPAPRR